MDLLARREHARRELEFKLAQRGYEDVEIAAALDGLEADRLLSDARFAEMYVRSREERGFGPLRIRAELKERGVTDPLIEQYLVYDTELLLERARGEHRKKYGDRSAGSYSERAKQARFLQARGFPNDIIWRVVGGPE